MRTGDSRADAPANGALSSLEASEVLGALARVLGSPSFAKSPRLQGFLRYIVEERLSGRTEPLKEYELGIRILGRPPDYDPRVDPIVRVQARQLRFKLREYYETSGSHDQIRIELPKGSYLPEIHRVLPKSPDETLVTQPPSAASLQAPKIRWTLTACAVVIAGLIAAVPMLRRHAIPRRPAHQPNAQARDLYLQGRYYWNKRSPESLTKALDYFTQATERDPDYAQAYVGLADTYNLLREYAAMPEHDAFPRAIAAARRAVALDDSSAEAHCSLAFDLFWGEWKAREAEREFLRAVTLNPQDARAHHWYSTALMAQGRTAEALAEIDRARELDPTSPAVAADYGINLFDAGRAEDGISVLKQLETTDPSFLSPHRYLAKIGSCTNDPHTFLLESRRVAELSHDPEALAIADAAAYGFAARGQSGMFDGILAVQKRLLGNGRLSAYAIAETCALAGKRDEAIGYLQDAFDKRASAMVTLRIECSFKGLRDDPSFRDLIARVSRAGGN